MPPREFGALLEHGLEHTVVAFRSERFADKRRVDRRMGVADRRARLAEGAIIFVDGFSVVNRRLTTMDRRRNLVDRRVS